MPIQYIYSCSFTKGIGARLSHCGLGSKPWLRLLLKGKAGNLLQTENVAHSQKMVQGELEA